MVHRITAIKPSDRLSAAILLLGVIYALILPDAWLTGTVAALAGPACVFLLQAFGFPALLDGGSIMLDQQTVSVVAESSGVAFLAIFAAFALAVAVRVKRPLWEKSVLVASTIPLGFIAVAIRLTGTCILLYAAGPRLTQPDCHPWTMLAMCCLAIGLLGLEAVYLKHLLIEANPASADRPVRTYPFANPPNRRRHVSSVCATT